MTPPNDSSSVSLTTPLNTQQPGSDGVGAGVGAGVDAGVDGSNRSIILTGLIFTPDTLESMQFDDKAILILKDKIQEEKYDLTKTSRSRNLSLLITELAMRNLTIQMFIGNGLNEEIIDHLIKSDIETLNCLVMNGLMSCKFSLKITSKIIGACLFDPIIIQILIMNVRDSMDGKDDVEGLAGSIIESLSELKNKFKFIHTIVKSFSYEDVLSLFLAPKVQAFISKVQTPDQITFAKDFIYSLENSNMLVSMRCKLFKIIASTYPIPTVTHLIKSMNDLVPKGNRTFKHDISDKKFLIRAKLIHTFLKRSDLHFSDKQNLFSVIALVYNGPNICRVLFLLKKDILKLNNYPVTDLMGVVMKIVDSRGNLSNGDRDQIRSMIRESYPKAVSDRILS